MLNNKESKGEIKRTVYDILGSISTILKETANRAIRKTKDAFEQADRNIKISKANQQKIAQ